MLRDVGAIVAGTDAADAALVPMADVLDGRRELAFDHLRIARDAIERVRVELEVTGVATAFVGSTFTLAELRAVYEAIWGVQLDAANFRRSVVSEDGWVIPTGRRAQPGPAGGRPAELYRAGQAWDHGGPIHRFPRPGRSRHESGRPRQVRTARRAARRGRQRPFPGDDEVLVRVHATTVNRTDCHRARRSRSSGASSPACGGRSGGSSGASSPARSRRSAAP